MRFASSCAPCAVGKIASLRRFGAVLDDGTIVDNNGTIHMPAETITGDPSSPASGLGLWSLVALAAVGAIVFMKS